MRRNLLVCCIGLLTVASGVHAAGTPGDYAYAYPLTVVPGAPAYLVDLPADAYTWARRDASLADISVVDADGRDVPFGRYTDAPPSPTPVEVSARLLPVPAVADGAPGARIQRNANGDIVIDPGKASAQAGPRDWLLDAKRSITLDALEFAPQSSDASITVNVEASNDLQHWELRAAEEPVISLKRGDDSVDQRTVRVGGEPARYYRVHLTQGDAPWADADAAAATVKLTGQFLDTTTAADQRRQWLDVPTSTPTPLATTAGTTYEFRLKAALPVDSVRVSLGDSDSVARFDVSTFDEASGVVQSMGEVSVTRVGGVDARPELSFQAARTQIIRLRTPVALRQPPKLSVGWTPDRFVFLPEGRAPYKLLVGSYMARRASYPVDDAIASLRSRNGDSWTPAESKVGTREDASGPAALEAPKVPYDWTRPLLWVVLIAGAALVAGMAISLLRKPRAP
ncbi:hypothetical protein FHW69_003433 [Luteibacter sp. Sphag1AF]|uniref:DUF3999 family protein n=1 Tax=Luteibacter sp. Sphag1AF TaxID=2587031 RepID=UPI001613BD7A|nr:DUF3999 family protein [Luteibacter sp. Sphag1AF]MBB3228788.1 hypothetical protein [Luteibacter sp. Sphag1AF]